MEALCGKMPLPCSCFCAEGKPLAGLGSQLSFLRVGEVWEASRLHGTEGPASKPGSPCLCVTWQTNPSEPWRPHI